MRIGMDSRTQAIQEDSNGLANEVAKANETLAVAKDTFEAAITKAPFELMLSKKVPSKTQVRIAAKTDQAAIWWNDLADHISALPAVSSLQQGNGVLDAKIEHALRTLAQSAPHRLINV